MDPFIRSQHLSWFQRGEAVFLYHDLFGYLLEMSADLKAFLDFFAEPHTAEEAVTHFTGTFAREQIGQFVGVFVQQRVLVPPGDQELDALVEAVPVKGPWILAYRADDGNVTAVTSRGFGPEPYAQPHMLALDPWQSELWRSIDGERTTRQIAASLTELFDGETNSDLGRAVVSIAAWTHASRQLTRVLTQPRSKYTRLPPYVTSTMPYPPFGEEVHDDAKQRDLTGYHAETIADSEAQFEELETTLSHLFSDPHPALEGHTFAQAFAHKLLLRDWIGPGRGRIVEVGGGTGRFAAGVVEALLPHIPDLHYTVVDVSPALHAAQVARLAPFAAHAQAVTGHAEHLELPDASVDLLVSNEVIADFRIGFVTRPALASGTPDEQTDAEALELVRKYALDTHKAPEPVPIQVGATRLIERLALALKPGGRAVLTEFGGENQFPIESTHLDHAEWSVHFGHLMQVARALGLEATLEPLPLLLGLQPDVWVLSSTRTQFRNLRYLLRSVGADLQKRALTPDQLALACAGKLRPDRIEGLQFRPVGERVMGLVPSEFQALVVRRP